MMPSSSGVNLMQILVGRRCVRCGEWRFGWREDLLGVGNGENNLEYKLCGESDENFKVTMSTLSIIQFDIPYKVSIFTLSIIHSVLQSNNNTF